MLEQNLFYRFRQIIGGFRNDVPPVVADGAPATARFDASSQLYVIVGGFAPGVTMQVEGIEPDGTTPPTANPIQIGAVSDAVLAAVADNTFVHLVTDLYRRLRTLPEGASADGAADGGLNPLKMGAVADAVLTAIANGQTAQLVSDLYRRLYTNPQGGVADDAADDGSNPVKIGGVAYSVLAAATSGDRVQAAFDLYRRLWVVIAGYDSGSNANRTFEVAPLNLQVLEESLLDAVNVAVGTLNYPSDDGLVMMGYKDLSLTGKFICGAGDNAVTMIVQGTNDEDPTPANRDWITLYSYRTDTNAVVNSIACAAGNTATFAWDFDEINYRYVRVNIVTANTGALSNTEIVKIRRKAL